MLARTIFTAAAVGLVGWNLCHAEPPASARPLLDKSFNRLSVCGRSSLMHTNGVLHPETLEKMCANEQADFLFQASGISTALAERVLKVAITNSEVVQREQQTPIKAIVRVDLIPVGSEKLYVMESGDIWLGETTIRPHDRSWFAKLLSSLCYLMQ